jgi:hypothetical protein
VSGRIPLSAVVRGDGAPGPGQPPRTVRTPRRRNHAAP